jgi:hypothetical protein
LVDSGLVERRLGWIFVALTTLFFLFVVMVAAGGVCVMGNDWLARVGHGGEKLSIYLICSSIFLLAFSFHMRNSDRIFSIFARYSSFQKIWKDIVMVWIGELLFFDFLMSNIWFLLRETGPLG